jgi:large subunit ribosomal protein L10
MNKEEKVKVVEELKGQLNGYKSIYLTDIAGLDAMQTSKLRRECFNSNVKISVVKNTFLERAMSESETDFGELKDLLKGNTTIMLSESGNSPAKVIKKFRKDGEKPILKGAFVDEAIYIGDDQIEALFNLKSKEEVLGPRGLMPNPKTGTVTMDIAKAVSDIKGGKIDFKVDKTGIVHASVGKVSFTADKIKDNANELIKTIVKLKPSSAKGTYIKSISMSSTMSPGIAIDSKFE